MQRVLEQHGRVDVLVNNAGVSQSHRLMDSTQADYDIVMDTSVRGAFNMSRAVVPPMRAQRAGAIVCIGSVAAQRGGGILGGPHYSAAKGAIQTLAKAMARELAPDGIRANAVAPGMVDTDLLVGKIDEAGKRRVAEACRSGGWQRPRILRTRACFSCVISRPTSRGWCWMSAGGCISTDQRTRPGVTTRPAHSTSWPTLFEFCAA